MFDALTTLQTWTTVIAVIRSDLWAVMMVIVYLRVWDVMQKKTAARVMMRIVMWVSIQKTRDLKRIPPQSVSGVHCSTVSSLKGTLDCGTIPLSWWFGLTFGAIQSYYSWSVVIENCERCNKLFSPLHFLDSNDAPFQTKYIVLFLVVIISCILLTTVMTLQEVWNRRKEAKKKEKELMAANSTNHTVSSRQSVRPSVKGSEKELCIETGTTSVEERFSDETFRSSRFNENVSFKWVLFCSLIEQDIFSNPCYLEIAQTFKLTKWLDRTP